MIARPVAPFSFWVDTVQPITDQFLSDIKADARAIVAVGRYVDSVDAAELARILGAGLGVLLFTYADEFDPTPRIAKLHALGIPKPATIVLDVESVKLDAPSLIARVSKWDRAIFGEGWDAGHYQGAGAILNTAQLSALPCDRYIKAMSRIYDLTGSLVEPTEGWCGMQLYPPNQPLGNHGLVVDFGVFQKDFHGRLPNLVWAA